MLTGAQRGSSVLHERGQFQWRRRHEFASNGWGSSLLSPLFRLDSAVVTVKPVVQHGGSSSGPGRVVSRQAGGKAKGQWELPDLGLSGKQDFLDEFQPRVPAFRFMGVVEARRPDEIRDGLRAVISLGRPDGELRVAIKDQFSRLCATSSSFFARCAMLIIGLAS